MRARGTFGLGGGKGWEWIFFSSFQFKPWEQESEIAIPYAFRRGKGRGKARPGEQQLTVNRATAAGRIRVTEVAVRRAGCESPGRHAAADASEHTPVHVQKRELTSGEGVGKRSLQRKIRWILRKRRRADCWKMG